jgi:MFS family permease
MASTSRLTLPPVLLLSLHAGALADKAPKRTLLLATQSVAMISALLLALLLFSGPIQVWHVLLAALIGGIVSASVDSRPPRPYNCITTDW